MASLLAIRLIIVGGNNTVLAKPIAPIGSLNGYESTILQTNQAIDTHYQFCIKLILINERLEVILVFLFLKPYK